MPDITMCKGVACDLRDTCYRYTAKPCGERQSWFTNSPITDDWCSYYWPNNEPESESK